MPLSYIRVRAVVWAYGRGQTDKQRHTDKQTDTQTRVTTIHFASSTTHAKCNKPFFIFFIFQGTTGCLTLVCISCTSVVQCKRTVVLRSAEMRNFSAAIRGNLRNVPHLIFRKLPLDNFPHSAFRKIPAPNSRFTDILVSGRV